jgi:hypothetical protein
MQGLEGVQEFCNLEDSKNIRKKDVMASIMSRDLEKEKTSMAMV